MAKPRDGSETGICPLDRTPLDPKSTHDLFPTPLIITNLIDDLQVYCLNYERGCEWHGRRWELDQHVLVDCGYTGVRCQGKIESPKEETDESIPQSDGENDIEEENKADEEDGSSDNKEDINEDRICNLIVERRFVSEKCCHILYDCDFCNQKINDVTKDKHLDLECLFNYQTCELCLNDMIPKKHMERHKENCQKVGRITCPAREIGCKWVGTTATLLEIHTQQCQLQLIYPTITKMQEELKDSTSENKFLQRQINKILDSIILGKITNLGYNESIEEISKKDSDKVLYLSFEMERLKYEMTEKVIPFMARQSLLESEAVVNNLINDNYLMKEDLNLQRMLINSLRKQLQFLLFRNNMTGPPGHRSDDIVDLLDVVSRSGSEERLNLKL